MGAGESKEKDSQVLSIFTADERPNIHECFVNIVGNQKDLTEPFLKKTLPKWLDERLRNKLYSVICKCQNNEADDAKRVTEFMFAKFLAEVLKGTYTDKADIVCLFSTVMHGHVSLFDLYQTVHALLTTYMTITQQDKHSQTWKTHCLKADIVRLCLVLLGIKKPPLKSDDTSKSVDDVETWISRCALFQKCFDHVFHILFAVVTTESRAIITKPLMPVAQDVDWSKTSTILDSVSITYINFHLPPAHQSQWRLLYSNNLHGDSFAQLVRYVCRKGPNLVVVRDKEAHVFGAYVSQDWKLKPNFYGSSDCFLFTLHPRLGIYNSTGYNENFMYFNQGQETLPNGLGLGGQLDYFGLWIDHSFNNGHSKAKPKCTTFGSPQLSGSEEFVVDSIEVWAVGQKKKKADEDEYSQPSVLDKDVGAKAILEMAGRKSHSDGLRELGEEECPMTDEMKRKMNTIPSMF